MRELSLNILDIVQNSLKAGAKNITILLEETENSFSFTVTDDGCGMDRQLLERVKDPFTTTRTTRKVGLGIPLLTLAARQTGGDVDIQSTSVQQDKNNHGTIIKAWFDKTHIDFTPLGDIVATVQALIQGAGDVDIEFCHMSGESEIRLSTKEMREILGDAVPLSSPDVLLWVREYLVGQYNNSEK